MIVKSSVSVDAKRDICLVQNGKRKRIQRKENHIKRRNRQQAIKHNDDGKGKEAGNVVGDNPYYIQ